MIKNYYQILGLDRLATKDEIKKSFRLYASKFHPDKQNGDKFFEERFREIKEAYENLYDDEKRAKYDRCFFNQYKQTTEVDNNKTESKTQQEKKDLNKQYADYFQPKPKTDKQKKRSKNIIIGIITIIVFISLMSLGKDGLHVPIAIFFMFWSIRQIFVVISSFIPD